MEPSENSELRTAVTSQAKSTGYFMKLRDWPEFNLIRLAGVNRLIVGSKTVQTIVKKLLLLFWKIPDNSNVYIDCC